jgi:adenylylsulfate kinase-like enzyme
MERDSQGYIKKALAGELPNLIGVSAPFEPPNNPEIRVNTDTSGSRSAAARLRQTAVAA